MARVLYVDVDGTLVGPGGSLFWQGSTRVADALVRAAAAGLTVVPVSGRGRVQVFELCRLLGLPRGIAELGCVNVDVVGRSVEYQFGHFPFRGETPVEAMQRTGAVQLAVDAGMEPFDPWNEGRVATYLLRGPVPAEVVADVAARLPDWCQLADNGHAYHLVPAGTGKADAVRLDRAYHRLAVADTAYVGDSASDVDCAAQVGRLWLVANADPGLEWPLRTASPYGDGVADVIEALLPARR